MVTQLFEGKNIRFAAFNPDKDAEVFAKWTNDPEYLRLTQYDPVRPLSPFHIKKKYEEIEKEMGREQFYFVIRTQGDDRAIGFAHIFWIQWNHGNARFSLGIASPDDRGKGYGTEALQMLLRYAFQELNLYRLTHDVFEYNPEGKKFLEHNGFQCEVRRREAIYRAGRYWDDLAYGILAQEWAASQKAENE